MQQYVPVQIDFRPPVTRLSACIVHQLCNLDLLAKDGSGQLLCRDSDDMKLELVSVEDSPCLSVRLL